MEREGLTAPELKVPVKSLIDECRNIGKIPNLGEYLATCRKYRIAISPIFQNYSQIVERMGKETVKTLSFGNSRGKMGSVSVNKQEVGRELMSRIQIEQMSNTECLVFIRALRPFKRKKYRLESHPNYKYTAEADKRYLRTNPYLLEFCDEEIEAVRVKPVGEEGYVEPKMVNSARKRALEVEKQKKAQAQAAAAKELDKMTLKETDETKSKEQLAREMGEKVNMPKVESSEVLQNYKVSQMQILDSYSPMYEFE